MPSLRGEALPGNALAFDCLTGIMEGMERMNAEGIFPRQLLWTLNNRRAVLDARRIDACLLCRRGRVNDAGLCEICYGMLDGDELRVAVRWLSGQGP